MAQQHVPHIYVDTNILVGVLEKQHTSSIDLLDLILKKGWKCSSSIFAFLEMFDVIQDNRYVLNQLHLGIHIKKAYKSLDQRNLSVADLKQISVNVRNIFSAKYPNIDYYQYGKLNWDTATELKISTNVSASDVIHLATAMEAGCDLLVTLDSFFLKEASAYIKTCQPEQVENLLQEMGFKV
jgi:predicted nucleic acid-binding protein